MRLISYRAGGETRLGARAGDAVVDLNSVDPNVPTDIVALLEGGDAAMAAARAALEKGGQPDRAPRARRPRAAARRPRPPKIVCVARNYAEHAAEAKLDVLSEPNLFIRFAQSLIADGAPIQVPRVSKAVDWEAELAVIIGRGGRHVSRPTRSTTSPGTRSSTTSGSATGRSRSRRSSSAPGRISTAPARSVPTS